MSSTAAVATPPATAPASEPPTSTAAAAAPEGLRKVSTSDIQLVQNLIERCLQLYMSQKEVVSTLQSQAKIEPGFTGLVWQKLEEQNPQFFQAYYTRLKLKDQIVLFNHLLEQQMRMVSHVQRGWFQQPTAFQGLAQRPGMAQVPGMPAMHTGTANGGMQLAAAAPGKEALQTESGANAAAAYSGDLHSLPVLEISGIGEPLQGTNASAAAVSPALFTGDSAVGLMGSSIPSSDNLVAHYPMPSPLHNVNYTSTGGDAGGAAGDLSLPHVFSMSDLKFADDEHLGAAPPPLSMSLTDPLEDMPDLDNPPCSTPPQ